MLLQLRIRHLRSLALRNLRLASSNTPSQDIPVVETQNASPTPEVESEAASSIPSPAPSTEGPPQRVPPLALRTSLQVDQQNIKLPQLSTSTQPQQLQHQRHLSGEEDLKVPRLGPQPHVDLQSWKDIPSLFFTLHGIRLKLVWSHVVVFVFFFFQRDGH